MLVALGADRCQPLKANTSKDCRPAAPSRSPTATAGRMPGNASERWDGVRNQGGSGVSATCGCDGGHGNDLSALVT